MKDAPAIRTIEVTVKLSLNSSVGEEEARQIVDEMEYSFDHALISDTEVVGNDIGT